MRRPKNSDKKQAKDISNRDEIVDAVGNLMVYCLGLCEMLDVDSKEVLEKIVENNRKNPYGSFVS